MEKQKVSQKLFEELTMLASCEDACLTLIDYLHETDTPEGSPNFVALMSLYNSVIMRVDSLVETPCSVDLSF